MAMDKRILKGTFKTLSLFALGLMLLMGIGGTVFVVSILKELPDVTSLKSFKHTQASEVYSDDNVKIGEFTKQRRYAVAFESIPRHVVSAFIAAEDSHFYEHRGIDP